MKVKEIIKGVFGSVGINETMAEKGEGEGMNKERIIRVLVAKNRV